MPRGARLSEAGRDVRRSPRAIDAGADPQGHVPRRTCVGCRRRDDRSVLLRLVVEPGESTPRGVLVVPDPRARRPGRGAWVHRDPGCLAAAERRRAVPRALRVQGPVDLVRVHAHLAAGSHEQDQPDQQDQLDQLDQHGSMTPTDETQEVGLAPHGHPMSPR